LYEKELHKHSSTITISTREAYYSYNSCQNLRQIPRFLLIAKAALLIKRNLPLFWGSFNNNQYIKNIGFDFAIILFLLQKVKHT